MSKKELIDVHTHLNDERLIDDLDGLIFRAKDAGVGKIINAACTVAESKQVADIAETHRECYATAGIHPHNALEYNGQSSLNKLKEILGHPKVLAVGEIGLDYHYNFSPAEAQKNVFRNLWLLAHELNMPAVLHIREAYDDFFEIINELPAPPKVMLHCFSGDTDNAKRAVDMGFHFSIGGILTFPKSDETREIFTMLPESRIHIETDAPYLAPQKKRGKTNEPAYLPFVLKAMAKVRNKTDAEMTEILWHNAQDFFGDKLGKA
ncbi:MAG: TatD family hydrolase [Candidatus Riflebacteria bacterium]|nr:TatD family hydrolase [Candidatus Riflebacteria bacterium]